MLRVFGIAKASATSAQWQVSHARSLLLQGCPVWSSLLWNPAQTGLASEALLQGAAEQLFLHRGLHPCCTLLAGIFKHRRQPGLEQYEALIQARTSESATALPSSFGEYLPERFENSVISPFSIARLNEESYAKYHSRNVDGKKPMVSFIFPCCYLVAQSCLTLCDRMDCSPPGSSVQEIPQV